MELLLDLLFSLLGDVLIGVVTSAFDDQSPERAKEPLRFFFFIVLGACAGALSTHVLPAPFITAEVWRVAWLLISPGIAALAVFAVQARFFPRAPRGAAMLHAAAFSFVIALWRYFTFG